MEITELATQTFDTLQPFLEAGGTELIKGIASDLWFKVKTVFTKKGEEQILQEFEQNPNDLKNKGKIEYILASELKTDLDLIDSLTKLVKSVKKSKEYSTVVNQVGNNNISIGGKISNSKINIQK